MFSIDFKNKVVVVTGASQGIGKAIAEVFYENGAIVILLSRNENKLKENIKRLTAVGASCQPAQYYVLDVSNPDQVKKIFKEIGHIEVLINNAGIYFTSSIADMDTKKWKELLETNLNGAMYCTKATLPEMIRKKYGRIINISSISGKLGDAYSSAYVASKFGLIGFTQSLAQEIAKENITANCICPGWTETKMAENIVHDENYAKLLNIPKEELKTSCLSAVPIGRYVHPKEVAYLALYLASDYASAITGQAINICGGLCMH
ncbi:MAG: SDR family oxidoreductase [Candidatus Melainabacteria bacterium]|nr:SDR family oxidoreductase [Candidatus Melainabacteria bacterium]